MSLVVKRASTTLVFFSGFQRGVFKIAHTYLIVALKSMTREEQEGSRTYAAYTALSKLLEDLPDTIETVED